MEKYCQGCTHDEGRISKCAKCDINYQFVDASANEIRDESSLRKYSSILQEKFLDAFYALQEFRHQVDTNKEVIKNDIDLRIESLKVDLDQLREGLHKEVDDYYDIALTYSKDVSKYGETTKKFEEYLKQNKIDKDIFMMHQKNLDDLVNTLQLNYSLNFKMDFEPSNLELSEKIFVGKLTCNFIRENDEKNLKSTQIHQIEDKINNALENINCSIKISRLARNFVSANDYNEVKLWNTQNFDTPLTFKTSSQYIRCMRFIERNLLAIGSQNVIDIWDLVSNSCIASLVGAREFYTYTRLYLEEREAIYDLVQCLEPLDENLLASGRSNGLIKVYDIDNQVMSFVLDCRNCYQSCNCLKLINSSILASGYDDTKIRLWNIETKTCDIEIDSSVSIYKLELLNTNLLLSGSYYGFIRLWDLNSQKCVKEICSNCEIKMLCLKLVATNLIACGYEDGNIRVWQTDSDRPNCFLTLLGHSKAVSCLKSLSPGVLLSGSEDKTLKIWNLKTKTCIFTLNGHYSMVKDLDII